MDMWACMEIAQFYKWIKLFWMCANVFISKIVFVFYIDETIAQMGVI